jgi:hypothetical protein
MQKCLFPTWNGVAFTVFTKKTKSFSFIFFTRNKKMFFVLYYITYWANAILSRQRGFAMTPPILILNTAIFMQKCLFPTWNGVAFTVFTIVTT